MEPYKSNDGFVSSVVELLALACALHVAFRILYVEPLTYNFDGVLVLVDNTSSLASWVGNRALSQVDQNAMAHVLRYASKLVFRGLPVKVMHKGLYGKKKNWRPHQEAAKGRTQDQAWHRANPPLCSVQIRNVVYGNFQGDVKSDGGLEMKLLIAFEFKRGVREKTSGIICNVLEGEES